LMTILIKLIFFPLTHHGQKSMAKMQEIQPKMQAMRAKYRGRLKDKQGRVNVEVNRQMQEEMMSIYRDAGVNPAAGCMPMLVQIPVFFAFYRLLATAVELRGAPWIGWVQDLAKPDPFWILPAMMLATGVYLQKMMPATADPTQRRIMQLMPWIFSVFAITFPAGLVLYWVTNNILTVGQQAVYLRSRNKDNPNDSAPANKRRDSSHSPSAKTAAKRG
ncbi:MAG: membrane protein insertase YidC, partial [Acidobacteriota bacterium]